MFPITRIEEDLLNELRRLIKDDDTTGSVDVIYFNESQGEINITSKLTGEHMVKLGSRYINRKHFTTVLHSIVQQYRLLRKQNTNTVEIKVDTSIPTVMKYPESVRNDDNILDTKVEYLKVIIGGKG